MYYIILFVILPLFYPSILDISHGYSYAVKVSNTCKTLSFSSLPGSYWSDSSQLQDGAVRAVVVSENKVIFPG